MAKGLACCRADAVRRLLAGDNFLLTTFDGRSFRGRLPVPSPLVHCGPRIRPFRIGRRVWVLTTVDLCISPPPRCDLVDQAHLLTSIPSATVSKVIRSFTLRDSKGALD
jgi:hypothetical protein